MPPKNYPAKIPLPQDEFLNVTYEPPSQLTDGNRRNSCIIMMPDPASSHSKSKDELFPLISTTAGKYGFASLQFDFRGCGDSSGTMKDFSFSRGLSDLRKMMDWLRNEYKHNQYILITQGLSAHIALQGFMPNLVTAMFFLWPNLNPLGSHLSFLKDKNNDPQVQKDGFFMQGDTCYGQNLINDINNIALKSQLEAISCPVLAQHGQDDQNIPVNNLDLLRDYMINSRLELGLFMNGQHGLHEPNMREALMTNIKHFLKKIS